MGGAGAGSDSKQVGMRQDEAHQALFTKASTHTHNYSQCGTHCPFYAKHPSCHQDIHFYVVNAEH